MNHTLIILSFLCLYSCSESNEENEIFEFGQVNNQEDLDYSELTRAVKSISVSDTGVFVVKENFLYFVSDLVSGSTTKIGAASWVIPLEFGNFTSEGLLFDNDGPITSSYLDNASFSFFYGEVPYATRRTNVTFELSYDGSSWLDYSDILIGLNANIEDIMHYGLCSGYELISIKQGISNALYFRHSENTQWQLILNTDIKYLHCSDSSFVSIGSLYIHKINVDNFQTIKETYVAEVIASFQVSGDVFISTPQGNSVIEVGNLGELKQSYNKDILGTLFDANEHDNLIYFSTSLGVVTVDKDGVETLYPLKFDAPIED